MTPAQWNKSKDARELLRYAAPRIPRQLLVLAAVACARTVTKHLNEATRRPALTALDVTTSWAVGRAALADVRDAGAAARAAAAAAAAAYADAAWRRTYDAKLAELAKLVRYLIPWPVVKHGARSWPERWFDADGFVEGLLIEAPVVDGLELVLFRDGGYVVEVATAKQVLEGDGVAQRMPQVLVAMDAAMEAR